MDKNKAKQISILKDLIDRALTIHGYETGFMGVDELPLNDQITLGTCNDDGNFIAYAVTTEKVVLWGDDNVRFEELDFDDIYTLQDIIRDEYQID